MDAAAPKERGAGEEVVAKRLKALNKKIQRFRAYKSQEEAKLNNDQRAALASLPQLEAVARELEEVGKQIEEAELVASSKQRELREATGRDSQGQVEARLAEFQLALATSLSGFLNLHSLLHPARPSDHANLTFAPLSLPPSLEDEVMATDILRVGRMYDDLVGGGDSAHSFLVALSNGPSVDDDEDVRIHKLLELLASADSFVPPPRSTAVEPAESLREFPSSTIAGSADGSSYANGDDPERTPIISMREFETAEPPSVAPHIAGLSRGVPLNFLQEDELEPKVDMVVIEQTVEVIEPSPVEMASAAVSVTATPTVTSIPASFDWTAEDELADQDSAELLRSALQSGVVTPGEGLGLSDPSIVSAVIDGDGAVDTLTAEVEAVLISDSTRDTATPQQRKKKPNQRRTEGSQSKDATPRAKDKDGSRGPQGKGKPRQPRPAQEAEPLIDSDGFETKVARRPSAAQRGRGAPAAGRGRGAGGGGRGGAREGGQRANGNGTPTKEGAAQRGPRKEGQPKPKSKEDKPAGPKPSIYKTTQPVAPASAPIF